jgi:superfamily II DNA helicase RecQ
MIGNNKDGPKLSPEEEKRQREDVYAVVSYCQDTVTCRRVQVLRYFGETFNSADCHRGCNNCTQPGTMLEQDFTQAAHTAAKLTKDILESSNKPTTQNHCQDVFLGLKHKEIKSRGHHELALHGEGRGLPKEIVERLFSKLLEMSVFQHVSVPNNSGYHNLYLEVTSHKHYAAHILNSLAISQLGPAIDDFLSKMPTVTLPVKPETVRPTVAAKKTKKQVPVKKLGSATKPKNPKLPEDEDPISFYEDSDNSFDHDDAIELYGSRETLPPAFPTSRKQAEEIEESHHDEWSALYEDLKAACHAVSAYGFPGDPHPCYVEIEGTRRQH